jgi:hypothetical protein
MPKRRKKYVAPIGRQLPAAPTNPGRGDLWEWIGECIGALMSWVPLEHEPDTLTWSDPHESIMKERWEKLAVEEEFSGEARTGFEHLREEGFWPDTSAQACFMMRSRMEWAIHMAAQFSLLARSPGCGGLKPSSGKAIDVCEWLSFDLYDTKFSWPKKGTAVPLRDIMTTEPKNNRSEQVGGGNRLKLVPCL